MGSHCCRFILVTAASCDLSDMSISPCRIFSVSQLVSRLLPLTWRADSPAIERMPETFASCLLPGLHPARCWCSRPLLMQRETCPATLASGLRSRGDDRQTDLCPEQ
ncbi:hypothetical protein T08_10951 [Trichinella sp. T8]|nr:hypothetical protein T08_10951 [Trichinella sp. T8]